MKAFFYVAATLCFLLPQDIWGAQEEELTFEGKLSAQITRDVYIPFYIQVEKVFAHMGENVSKGEKLLEYTLHIKDLRPLQNEIDVAGGIDDLEMQDINMRQERLSKSSQFSLDSELASKGLLSPQKKAQNNREADLLKKRYEAFTHKKQSTQENFSRRLQELENYFGFPVKAKMKLPKRFYLTANMNGTIIDMASQARPGGYLSGKIFTIGQLNPIQAQIEVHESEITKLRVGQTVTVNPVNDNSQKFTGKIIMLSLHPINPAIAVPSYYYVWVDVDNPDQVLKPGYKVIIHVDSSKS